MNTNGLQSKNRDLEGKYELEEQSGFKKGHSAGWQEGFKEGQLPSNERIFNYGSTNSKKNNQVNLVSGRRIVDIQLLNEHIKELACCRVCHGSIDLVNEENIEGLSSSLIWRCSNCYQEISIPTSLTIKSKEKFAKPRAEINILAVGAIEMIGKGYKGLDTILGHLNIPNMVHKTFDLIAKFIGSYAKTIADESMNKAQLEEKNKLAINSSINDHKNYKGEGITDAGWQKRSYNHNCNSLSGVSVLLEKQTGKILDNEVLSCQCKVCDVAKQKGLPVKFHECTATWNKSAKAMEPEMAVRMWNRSAEYGIHFDVQIGDEDSATQKRLQEDVEIHLRPTHKLSDFLHIKRNFSNHLFKLKPHYKKILSKAIILKLVSDFSTALKTNIGNIQNIKKALENIIPHNYGEHFNCGEWCKAKCDSTYTPKLPHGKYLDDRTLRKDLKLEISTFTTLEVLNKIFHCSSSQGAEQTFSMLSKLALKDIHYSSSPTLKRRVNYLVSQYNEDTGYGGLIWNKIGIKRGIYQMKAYNKWEKKKVNQTEHKKMETFKI